MKSLIFNKVLIIGAGAIGGFYGSLHAKSGAYVAVVRRSGYDHVKNHGFKIDSSLIEAAGYKKMMNHLNPGPTKK